MSQKILTEYEILVTEYDATGYYHPKYDTTQIIIADSKEKAMEEAIIRTPLKRKLAGTGWVQKAVVIRSKDIVIQQPQSNQNQIVIFPILKKFEYKTVDFGQLSGRYNQIDLDKLNELGSDGWEFISVESGICIFKREVIK